MQIKCLVCQKTSNRRKGAKYCSSNCKLIAWAFKKQKDMKEKKK